MAAYKSEVLDHTYAGKLRPRSHYALGWLPRWGRLITRSRPLAGAGQSDHRHPGAAPAGALERRGGPAPAAAAVRRSAGAGAGGVGARPSTGREAGGRLGRLVLRLLHRRRGRGGGRGAAAAGYAPAAPGPGRLLRADLDQHRPARGRPPAAADRAWTCCTRTWPRARPIVGLEPSCTAVWRSDAAGAAARRSAGGRGRGRGAHAGRAAGPDTTAGHRPTCPASRSSPSRTATTPRCWAGRPTPPLLKALRRDGDHASAAAAAWPATSGSRRVTTTCRSRWPSTTCCPPSRPIPTRSCWPTDSPAGPSWPSWPARRRSRWPELLAPGRARTVTGPIRPEPTGSARRTPGECLARRAQPAYGRQVAGAAAPARVEGVRRCRVEIACDESGFTGGNLTFPQAVFAHASLRIPSERPRRRWSGCGCRVSAHGELKASWLLRWCDDGDLRPAAGSDGCWSTGPGSPQRHPSVPARPLADALLGRTGSAVWICRARTRPSCGRCDLHRQGEAVVRSAALAAVPRRGRSRCCDDSRWIPATAVADFERRSPSSRRRRGPAAGPGGSRRLQRVARIEPERCDASLEATLGGRRCSSRCCRR